MICYISINSMHTVYVVLYFPPCYISYLQYHNFFFELYYIGLLLFLIGIILIVSSGNICLNV